MIQPLIGSKMPLSGSNKVGPSAEQKEIAGSKGCTPCRQVPRRRNHHRDPWELNPKHPKTTMIWGVSKNEIIIIPLSSDHGDLYFPVLLGFFEYIYIIHTGIYSDIYLYICTCILYVWYTLLTFQVCVVAFQTLSAYSLSESTFLLESNTMLHGICISQNKVRTIYSITLIEIEN